MTLAVRPPAPAHRVRVLRSLGLARAREAGRPVLVTATEEIDHRDAVSFFAEARARGEDVTLLGRPEEGRAFVGAGAAQAFPAGGAAEASAAGRAWGELLADAMIVRGDAPEGIGPVLLGGFEFDPVAPSSPIWSGYPAGLLVLPRLLLTNAGDRSWLTTSVVVRDGDDLRDLSSPSPIPFDRDEQDQSRRVPRTVALEDYRPVVDWKATVARASSAVRSGALEKVAIARAVRASGDAPFRSETVLRRLRESYPSCTVFAVARGGKCFIGASPERLVSLRDGVVRTASVAGSRPRRRMPDADARLGRELFESAKDRWEHEVVVRMLSAALRAACGEALAPAAPELLRVANVQHLYTPIVARARLGQSVLHLVAALHPTPAVGGYPREEAMALIRREEGLDRGWYAAPVGWVDARGEGEFSVAIRSALLDGDCATLYAGCGIVGDSDPEAEWEESGWKLRPMLDALRGVAE